MIRRNGDEYVTVDECNRRHGTTFWTLTMFGTLLTALIGASIYMVGLGLDASKQADAAVAEVKIEARGNEAFRGEVLRSLREIKDDVRELKHGGVGAAK